MLMEKAVAEAKSLFKEDKLLLVCLLFYCAIFAGFFFMKTGLHRNIFYVSLPFSLAAVIKYRADIADTFRQNRLGVLFTSMFFLYVITSLLWSNVTEAGREFDKAKILLFLPLSMLTLNLLIQRVNFSYNWLVTAFVSAAALAGFYLFGLQIASEWHFRLQGLGRAENSVLAGYLYALAILAVLYAKPFIAMAWKYKAPLLGILFAILLFSLSRGPLLALTITVFILCMIKGYRKAGTAIILACILCLSIIFATGIQKKVPILNRSDTGRTQVWAQAIEHIKDSPLYGHGIGSKFYYDIKRPNGTIAETASHPHSLYLGIFIQGGIIAVFLLFGMLFVFLTTAYRHARMNGEFWPLAVLISCTIMGLYDFGGLYVNMGVPWIAFWYQYALATRSSHMTFETA